MRTTYLVCYDISDDKRLRQVFKAMLDFGDHLRFGRAALALDLMEEFRPLIADSVVINAINTGMVTADDFIVAMSPSEPQ